MKLLGKVCSGKGDFAQRIAGLNDHYKRKTGLVLFPGTLNVRLEDQYHIPPNPLHLEAEEYGGRVSVNLVPCKVFGRKAFILRTDKEEAGKGSHPFEVIEIATDINLRDTHNLVDGSTVEIELG